MTVIMPGQHTRTLGGPRISQQSAWSNSKYRRPYCIAEKMQICFDEIGIQTKRAEGQMPIRATSSRQVRGIRTVASIAAVAMVGMLSAACSGVGLAPKALIGIGPIECAVNTALELGCTLGKEWVFGLGPVKLGVGVDVVQENNGALVLTIDQPDGTSQGWRIGDDDRPLCLQQAGSITTYISKNLIRITPRVGAWIRITDPIQSGTGCATDGPSAAGPPPNNSGVTIVTQPSPDPTGTASPEPTADPTTPEPTEPAPEPTPTITDTGTQTPQAP